jgi:hypothetical protein
LRRLIFKSISRPLLMSALWPFRAYRVFGMLSAYADSIPNRCFSLFTPTTLKLLFFQKAAAEWRPDGAPNRRISGDGSERSARGPRT